MWTLIRLPEFYGHIIPARNPPTIGMETAEAAASLQFPKGLLIAIALATPFWTAVAVFVHHLAK